MNDSRGPEGNRMQMPGWEPAEDNAARPYLDQVADLQAKLAEKEAQRPGGISNAEAEKSRRAERDAFFKSLVIKLDGAARRSAPGVVEDIDAKFNALQEYLTEADRLQMQMGPGKQLIYKVLERAADGKSKLTMGELEAARGHFLSWHSQDGQPIQDAPAASVAPPVGGVLGMVVGIARNSSQASVVHERSSAHLKAYFGKDFRKFHKVPSSRSFGFLKVAALSIALCLGAVIFYQGMDSQSDKFDDALGFFGRVKYNMAKLRTATAQEEVPEFLKSYVGKNYIDRLNASQSPDLVTVALKASLAEQTATLEAARANLAKQGQAKLAAQLSEGNLRASLQRGDELTKEALEADAKAAEARASLVQPKKSYSEMEVDRSSLYVALMLASDINAPPIGKISTDQASLIAEFVEREITKRGKFSSDDNKRISEFILAAGTLKLSGDARKIIIEDVFNSFHYYTPIYKFENSSGMAESVNHLLSKCETDNPNRIGGPVDCEIIKVALAKAKNGLTINRTLLLESLMDSGFTWRRAAYFTYGIP